MSWESAGEEASGDGVSAGVVDLDGSRDTSSKGFVLTWDDGSMVSGGGRGRGREGGRGEGEGEGGGGREGEKKEREEEESKRDAAAWRY